jgi:hypothetical protein
LHNAARRSIEICLKDKKSILCCWAKNSQNQEKMLHMHQNE